MAEQNALNEDKVLTALRQQLDCYQRLSKLARTQHDHVQNCRSEDLLDVLKQRQGLIDETAKLEKVTGPAKRNWPEYAAKLSAPQREEAESLVGRIRDLMAEIVAADRDDTLVLQQRMLNTGRAINQATAAKKFNQAYAKAAYGTARERLDLHR
jgi:hypothetical protein